MYKFIRLFYCLLVCVFVGQATAQTASSRLSEARKEAALDFYTQDFSTFDSVLAPRVRDNFQDSLDYAKPPHYINHNLATEWLQRMHQSGELDRFANRFYKKHAAYFLEKYNIEIIDNEKSPLFWNASLKDYRAVLSKCVQSFTGDVNEACLWQAIPEEEDNVFFNRYTKVLFIIGATYSEQLAAFRTDFVNDRVARLNQG